MVSWLSETQRCFLKAVGLLGFAISTYRKRVLANCGFGSNTRVLSFYRSTQPTGPLMGDCYRKLSKVYYNIAYGDYLRINILRVAV